MVRVRLLVAAFLSFLVIATTLPNLGHIDPTTRRVARDFADLWPIAVFLAPLLLIYVGVYYSSKIAEGIGWVLLSLVVFLRFAG